MSESTEYEQLVEKFSKLQDTAYREAFDEYIERLWTKPSTFKEYFQAYLEFTTPEKPTFGKLNAMEAAKQEKQETAPQKSRRRRSRRGRRRSSSRKKQN